MSRDTPARIIVVISSVRMIKPSPQKRGCCVMMMSFRLFFVCRLKRVLVGHWLTRPAAAAAQL